MGSEKQIKQQRTNKHIVVLRMSQLLVLMLILLASEFSVRYGLINKLFLAEPSQIWNRLIYMLAHGLLIQHVIVTMKEFAVGFGISAVTGISLGVLFVVFPKLEEFLDVFISALMAIPKVAIIPLLIVWFGIGFVSKVVLVFLFCFFNILYNTVTGAKQTREDHLKVARVFKATQTQTVFKVIIPSALPNIINGLRVSAAGGLTGVLFSEMIAAKDGLGYLLSEAQQVLNTPQLYLVIILVTLISVSIVSLINVLETIICHNWQPRVSAGNR